MKKLFAFVFALICLQACAQRYVGTVGDFKDSVRIGPSGTPWVRAFTHDTTDRESKFYIPTEWAIKEWVKKKLTGVGGGGTKDTFGISNSLNALQFRIAPNDNLRFEGQGNTSVSFDPATKKIIIASTADTGADGNNYPQALSFDEPSKVLTMTRSGLPALTLNIPYKDGTVTSFGFTNSNGFTGTVNNSTTTPSLTLSYNEGDPLWSAAINNYYTKNNLQTGGQALVNWNNLTNIPSNVGQTYSNAYSINLASNVFSLDTAGANSAASKERSNKNYYGMQQIDSFHLVLVRPNGTIDTIEFYNGDTGASGSYANGTATKQALFWAGTTYAPRAIAASDFSGTATNGYVLSLVGGVPTWQAASGGGGSYTFSNGTTETAGAVKLGGGLSQNTTVDGGSNYWFSFNNIKELYAGNTRNYLRVSYFDQENLLYSQSADGTQSSKIDQRGDIPMTDINTMWGNAGVKMRVGWSSFELWGAATDGSFFNNSTSRVVYVTISKLPTYDSESAAAAANMQPNQLYKTTTGEIRIKL